jgi:leader peptidase (prepilin peptidase)/N-methyltransferase
LPLATPILLFFLGLIFGSFLNVCIYRLPLDLSIVRPRSFCPHCERPISGFDNIPVLSWILLRGRCRRCAQPISIRYPLVEIITGLLFAACAIHFHSPLPIAKCCIFALIVLGLIFTDLDHQILPDELTLGGLLLGLAFSLVVWVQAIPGLVYLPSHGWQVRLFSLLNSVAGAAVGAGIVYLIGEFYRLIRGRHGMGFGDVKLMGLIGAFLGIKLVLLVLFLGSLLGALAGVGLLLRQSSAGWSEVRHTALPFGTFLGTAALFAAFWGNRMLDWYWNLW